MQEHPRPLPNSSSQSEGQATLDDGNTGDFDASAPNQSASAAADLMQLILLTCLGSLIITGYVWAVNKYSVHRIKTDIVENAAILAARELSEITVQHSSLGDIGLCDLPPGRTSGHGISRRRAIGINHLYDTLNIDREIAVKLDHQLIKRLVKNDFELTQKLEQELSQKLKQAVEPDLSQSKLRTNMSSTFSEEQDNNVYRDVYRMISADREAKQSSSIEVKIALGRARTAIFTRDCDAHPVDSANFQATTDGPAPYLVQVEVTYDKRGKGKPGEANSDSTTSLVKQRRCALIATPDVDPFPAALVINFPAAVPPIFRSAFDILSYKKWNSIGDWQQAVGSNVPGSGSLAPPLGSVMPSMSPGDALAVALYDWLKSAGAGVDPDRAVELIRSAWDIAPLTVTGQRPEEVIDGDQSTSNVNSCLARDTGAREYSIMNQTAPGSTGQTALARAFAIFDQNAQTVSRPSFPPSALPLFVDKFGRCNLAGRHGYDKSLITDFLSSVQQTNLAAIASLATAKQLVAATNANLNQLEQKMYIEKQELASVSSRLARLPDAASEKQSHRVLLIAERIATLKAIIEADERQRHKFQRMNRLANQATINAVRVSTSTFDLGARAFKLCRSGLYRIDSPKKGYLIGTKYVFYPYVVPLSETDFATIESQLPHATTGKGADEPESPWLAKSLESVLSIESAFQGDAVDRVIVEGRTLSQLLQNPPICASPAHGMIVLDSSSTYKTTEGKPVAHAYRQYAFADIPIPPGQLLYYCQNAAQTGESPKVSWSVLLRDLVSSKGTSSADEPGGNPIASQETNWCGHGSQRCPGLACEIQLRCPLPVLDQTIEDAYLKNPTTNAQVPQIPPVPPDML